MLLCQAQISTRYLVVLPNKVCRSVNSAEYVHLTRCPDAESVRQRVRQAGAMHFGGGCGCRQGKRQARGQSQRQK